MSFILNSLIAFGAFQALFISIIFLLDRQRSLTKKLFASFLIIEGFTLLERLLAETGLIEMVPHIIGISYPISFIKPPVILLTAFAIINPDFKLRKIHSLHFLLFLLMLFINLPFYGMDADYKLSIVEAFLSHVPSYDSFDFYLSLSFFLNIGIYIGATIVTLNRYRSHIKTNKLANWYLSVMWIYGLSLTICLIYFAIQPAGIFEIPLFNTISMLTMTFVIQSIAYRFFRGADVFHPKKTAGLNDMEQWAQDEKLILEKLRSEKAYLDDALTLPAFAASLNLPKQYVSDLMNQRMGSTFSELINRYRIEEAKAIMKKEENRQRPLIDIAQESGFNNKVSFYRAFKKHAGMSPSEYFQQLKSTVHH